MSDPQTQSAITRLENALSRAEAALAARPRETGEADSRYQTLRARTQAALASLETVIAQVGAEGRR